MIAAKVARGAVFLVGAQLMTRGLDLIAMLVVARFLTPADFGLVALAATVLLILDAATNISLSTAIVQMRDPPRSAYDTAFTLNLIRGILLALVVALLAKPFAALYGDPRLVPLMLVLTASPLARGLVSPRLAARTRDLSFREQTLVQITGKAAAFVVSVAIAIALESYWALIAGMVAAPAVSGVVSYVVAPYRPRLGLAGARAMFGFSVWVALSGAVNQLNWQLDRLLLGYRLGTAVLGQYTIGSTLASLPTQAPVQPMMNALFAGFTRVVHEPARFRASYLASQTMVMALALPIGCAVSALAWPIVDVALGPEWETAAFVVATLAPVFAVQMLTGPAQAAAMAAGETRTILVRDIIALAVRLPLIVIGMLSFGLVGVVVARVISGVGLIGLNLAMMRRIAGVSVAEQVRAPWRSMVAAAVMAAALWTATLTLYSTVGSDVVERIGYLVVATGMGGLIYVAVHLALWAVAGRPDGPERRLITMVAQIMPVRIPGKRGGAHG